MSTMRMGHVAGVSLALLLGAAAIVEAQVEKRRPGGVAPPVTGRQPAPAQQSGPQVATGGTQMANIMLPCCVVEGVEKDVGPKGKLGKAIPQRTGGVLVVKDIKTGQVYRMRVSGASSAMYRAGQLVERTLDGTRIAVTPFPVKDSKESKIKGKSSWKMWTDVTVSNSGRIDGKTKIKSSEAARGFTGGVEVVLTDRAGNILHQTQLRTYGVNGTAMGGQSSRTVNWNETVSPDALNKVRAVVIHHSYEPKVRLAAGAEWLKNNWDVVVKVYKCGKELWAGSSEDGQQPTGSPAPPPPAPGQSTTQPPASDSSILECLDATQQLADSLGY
ncbi:MAG: hypothetical protein M3Q75_06545 [Gemmatimonadota bacterium]|nr:hypothetical protein [Gemmatimonadota bacterium]